MRRTGSLPLLLLVRSPSSFGLIQHMWLHCATLLCDCRSCYNGSESHLDPVLYCVHPSSCLAPFHRGYTLQVHIPTTPPLKHMHLGQRQRDESRMLELYLRYRKEVSNQPIHLMMTSSNVLGSYNCTINSFLNTTSGITAALLS